MTRRHGTSTVAVLAAAAVLGTVSPAGAAGPGVFGDTLNRYSVRTQDGPGRPAVALGNAVSVSGDGRYAAFLASGHFWGGADPGPAGAIYVRDRVTRTTTNATPSATGGPADSYPVGPQLSADGRYLAYWSPATNRVAGDTNEVADVFVRDLRAGTTVLASRAAGGRLLHRNTTEFSLSGTGRWLAFVSGARDVVPGIPTPDGGCFLRDLVTGTVDVVFAGFCHLDPQAVSDDGRFVAYSAFDPVVTDAAVYVRDRELGRTVLASGRPDGVPADGGGASYALSGDARSLAFSSTASDLLPGIPDRAQHVYVRTLGTPELVRVSVRSDGRPVRRAGDPAISRDGQRVVWMSNDPAVVTGDSNDATDVFVHDRSNGTTTRATAGRGGVAVQGGTFYRSPISADGRHVAFLTKAEGLVPSDGNRRMDAFLRSDLP